MRSSIAQQSATSGGVTGDGFPQESIAGARMSDREFEFFRGLAHARAGITLPDYKRNMVHRRVSKRLNVLRLSEFASYVELLRSPQGEAEIEYFVSTLTTNKTEFFRERHHFDHLAAAALPRIFKLNCGRTPLRLRIWSAGCSSGQEPYSIAITLATFLAGRTGVDARILATDIDTDMVEKGERGVYPAEDLSAIPFEAHRKHVEPVPGNPGRGRISLGLRSLVTFNQLNLHGPWPMKDKFDVIFCRNVIIYFDKAAQVRLFDRFADLMTGDGYLYIGHSESLFKVTERFKSAGQSVYQKVE